MSVQSLDQSSLSQVPDFDVIGVRSAGDPSVRKDNDRVECLVVIFERVDQLVAELAPYFHDSFIGDDEISIRQHAHLVPVMDVVSPKKLCRDR